MEEHSPHYTITPNLESCCYYNISYSAPIKPRVLGDNPVKMSISGELQAILWCCFTPIGPGL